MLNELFKALVNDGIARSECLHGIGGIKETKAQHEARIYYNRGLQHAIEMLERLETDDEYRAIIEKEYSEGKLWEVK